jgi:hypothetical protein
MREISAERFERLERQVRRLWGLVMVLVVGIAGVLLMGATGKPDELTLRKLTIVDAEGRERITARTLPGGGAGVQHYDRDGKLRITAETPAASGASVAHFVSDQ